MSDDLVDRIIYLFSVELSYFYVSFIGFYSVCANCEENQEGKKIDGE